MEENGHPDFTPEQGSYESYINVMFLRLCQLPDFPFIADDFDSLTMYEKLCKIVGAVDKLIQNMHITQTNVETMEANIQALYNSYMELQSYIDNWFTNLDIQAEVDQKLNEMHDNGQLYNLIEEFLKAETVKTYNTYTGVEGLYQDSPNLVLGQKVMTLGYNTINDGGTAKFYVDDTVLTNHYQIPIPNTAGTTQLYLTYLYPDSDSKTIPVEVFGYAESSDISELFNDPMTNYYDTLSFNKAKHYTINPNTITTHEIINKTIIGNNATLTIANVNGMTLSLNGCYFQNITLESDVAGDIITDIITLNGNNKFHLCHFKVVSNNTTTDLITLIKMNKGINLFTDSEFISEGTDTSAILFNAFTNQDESIDYRLYISDSNFIGGKDGIFIENQTDYTDYSVIIETCSFEGQNGYVANINSKYNNLMNLVSDDLRKARELINITNDNLKFNRISITSKNGIEPIYVSDQGSAYGYYYKSINVTDKVSTLRGGTWVNTPLTWGINTGVMNKIDSSIWNEFQEIINNINNDECKSPTIKLVLEQDNESTYKDKHLGLLLWDKEIINDPNTPDERCEVYRGSVTPLSFVKGTNNLDVIQNAMLQMTYNTTTNNLTDISIILVSQDILLPGNESRWEPTLPFDPATKEYVDLAIMNGTAYNYNLFKYNIEIQVNVTDYQDVDSPIGLGHGTFVTGMLTSNIFYRFQNVIDKIIFQCIDNAIVNFWIRFGPNDGQVIKLLAFDYKTYPSADPNHPDQTVYSFSGYEDPDQMTGYLVNGEFMAGRLSTKIEIFANTSDHQITAIFIHRGIFSYLPIDNSIAYTPSLPYDPATKKYVDDNAGGGNSQFFEITLDQNIDYYDNTSLIQILGNDKYNQLKSIVVDPSDTTPIMVKYIPMTTDQPWFLNSVIFFKSYSLGNQLVVYRSNNWLNNSYTTDYEKVAGYGQMSFSITNNGTYIHTMTISKYNYIISWDNDIYQKPTNEEFQADWLQNDNTKLGYIKNKPTIPSEYNLPVASIDNLGGIKVGNNLSIEPDGTLNASGGGSLPIATDSILGGVKIGNNMNVTPDGVITSKINNTLTSTLVTESLSANQGRILNEGKVDKIAGKGLSTNDFTNAEKTKLDGVQVGAEANVQSNWNETNTGSDSYILNKPTIPNISSGTAEPVGGNDGDIYLKYV